MALNSSDFSSGGNAKFENESKRDSSKASFFIDVLAEDAKSSTVVVPDVGCDSIDAGGTRLRSAPGKGGRSRFSTEPARGTGGTLSSTSVGLFDGTLSDVATEEVAGCDNKRLEVAKDSKWSNSFPKVSPSSGSAT